MHLVVHFRAGWWWRGLLAVGMLAIRIPWERTRLRRWQR